MPVARGIVEGSLVKVFNGAGALVIKAHLTQRIRPA